ncbi:hypothetical protein LIER_17878 [Lithospermum erythrorhizon]|uniref:Uncharacterized protein n=1 Tax=Lithospermum erythrorhizon TaxID=34254 RepID=A0AAV3QF74_LITER
MDATIIVSSIVDKLCLGWKDCKHIFKHKKEDTSLEEWTKSLHIEEDFLNQENGKDLVSLWLKLVNLVIVNLIRVRK